jgi:hypothetical protein
MGENDDAKDAEVGLPGAAGAIAKVANSGPGKALLTPAAKVFGQYFGWRAEQMVADWKAKREANVGAHYKKVSEREGPAAQRQPTEKQIKLISDWVEGAQEIDPDEDPEVAAAWQVILGEIFSKAGDAREMLDAIRQLDDRDVKLIVQLDNAFTPKQHETKRAKRLAQLGILEGFDIFSFIQSPTTALVVGMLFLAGLAASIPEDTFGAFVSIRGMLLLTKFSFFILAGACCAFLAILLMHSIQRYHLSRLGLRIQTSARKYLENESAACAASDAAQAQSSSAPNKKKKAGRRPEPKC